MILKQQGWQRNDAKLTTVARSLTPVGEEGVKRISSKGFGKRKIDTNTMLGVLTLKGRRAQIKSVQG